MVVVGLVVAPGLVAATSGAVTGASASSCMACMAGLIIQKTLAGRIFDFGSRISILKKCGLKAAEQKSVKLVDKA